MFGRAAVTASKMFCCLATANKFVKEPIKSCSGDKAAPRRDIVPEPAKLLGAACGATGSSLSIIIAPGFGGVTVLQFLCV